MNTHVCRAALGLLGLCAASTFTTAQTVFYSDRAAFLSSTGAQPAPAWPNLGRIPGDAAATFHLGHLTLSVSPPSGGLWVGSGNHSLVGPDWTTLVEGNDLAIDGQENLNIDLDQPMRVFGFEFAEPTTVTVQYPPCSPACPCANSTFHVVLRRADAEIGAFDFNRPDNTAAFVGFTCAAAFDRVEIRETSGSCDDEYFGRMYTRCAAPLLSTQPAPQAACPLGTATFAVNATGTDVGTLTYQWQVADPNAPGGWANINAGSPLWNGDAVAQFTSGNPAVLSVELFFDTYEQGRSVRCVVANAGGCGAVTSNPATLFVAPADLGQQGGTPGPDGQYDNNDFVVFIDYFFTLHPRADIGQQGGTLGADGLFDNNDFVVFIDQFFTGC